MGATAHDTIGRRRPHSAPLCVWPDWRRPARGRSLVADPVANLPDKNRVLASGGAEPPAASVSKLSGLGGVSMARGFASCKDGDLPARSKRGRSTATDSADGASSTRREPGGLYVDATADRPTGGYLDAPILAPRYGARQTRRGCRAGPPSTTGRRPALETTGRAADAELDRACRRADLREARGRGAPARGRRGARAGRAGAFVRTTEDDFFNRRDAGSQRASLVRTRGGDYDVDLIASAPPRPAAAETAARGGGRLRGASIGMTERR